MENFSILEELAAQAIAYEFSKYMKQTGFIEKLGQEMDSIALRTLEEIRRALNDDSLNDPECFNRIEAIINALDENGLSTTRHDW